jgi:transcriptional regulator with XRE-family HTH domain
MKEFGMLLREIRKQNNLKICELANKIGVTPEFVTQVEKGNKYPSKETFAKLVKILGKTIEPVYYKERYADMIVFVKNNPHLLAEVKSRTK